MEITGATLFSGGGGVECGMIMAGIKPLWGVELNDKIAEVARKNGFHVKTGDVTLEDPSQFPHVNILHASPPCINASTIKHNGKETELDKELALATCRFIKAINPDVFTLENVKGYLKFESFQTIKDTLQELGYFVWHKVLNAADFGVPQNRQRLILIATKEKIDVEIKTYPKVSWDQVVILTEEEQISFEKLPNWLHWYLPEDKNVDFWGVFSSNSKSRSIPGKGTACKGNCSHTILAESGHKSIFARINGVYYRPNCNNIKSVQSFPSNYELSGSKYLDARIIGNAVAPLMYARVIEGIKEQLWTYSTAI